MMDQVKLFTGDCQQLPLEDNSIDLVFTSPPYEDRRTYSIDFNLKGDDWVNWCVPRFLECIRVCKGLVCWVVCGKTKNYEYTLTPEKLMVKLRECGVILRRPCIFHRVGIPGSGGRDWLRNDYEIIICATKDKKRLNWSDNIACGHPPKWAPGGEMSYRLKDGARTNQWGRPAKDDHGTTNLETERQVDGTLKYVSKKPSHKTVKKYDGVTKANPGNIIKCNVGGGCMGHKLAHANEASFPESLASFFIKSFCPPNGIVLDPMCGSGTTCAVALKEGRQTIGMDIRQSQIDITRERIEDISA